MFNLFKSARTVLVVDAVSLNESLGMKGKVSPRNQLQTLRRLSRFAQREKVEVVAVLTGAPLHKAPAGKKFEGIVVLYSKSFEAHAKFMAKTTKSKGAGGILVTGNVALEKAAGKGVKKMRISTFRKGFDMGGDNEGGNDRSENGNRSRNNNRPPRRKQQNQSNAPKSEKKPERPAKQNSDTDAINELIDLVD